jgi:Tfp pilus assembly protein PilX
MTTSPHRQRGAALIVSLIMLLLITMLALSSFTLAKSNLQIVGNMQLRNQAFSAAQAAVASVISSTQFTQTPTNAIPANAVPAFCAGGPNTTCVDINGDGAADITVAVNPTCDSIQPILVTQLNFNNPNDAGCLVGAAQDFGVAGASNDNSMCSNSVWEIQASATDRMSNANYVVDQGVALRVPATSACP